MAQAILAQAILAQGILLNSELACPGARSIARAPMSTTSQIQRESAGAASWSFGAPVFDMTGDDDDDDRSSEGSDADEQIYFDEEQSLHLLARRDKVALLILSLERLQCDGPQVHDVLRDYRLEHRLLCLQVEMLSYGAKVVPELATSGGLSNDRSDSTSSSGSEDHSVLADGPEALPLAADARPSAAHLSGGSADSLASLESLDAVVSKSKEFHTEEIPRTKQTKGVPKSVELHVTMLLEILWGPRNMVFKIKASSPLKVLMDAFCARASVESSAVVFLDYRYGSQVQPTDSAYDLGFISGSKIVVTPNVPYTLFYDPGPATAPCSSKTASTTPPTASASSPARSSRSCRMSPTRPPPRSSEAAARSPASTAGYRRGCPPHRVEERP